MKKLLFIMTLSITPLFCIGQTVDAFYLNPQGDDGTPYIYTRFGNATTFWGGFMWNNNSPIYGDGDDFTIFTYGNRDINLRTGTGNVIIFPSSGGNVGIGTTTPDAKLAVRGDIHTREVRVDLNGAVAPDFVFEPDYKLRTLAETETYIKENKHLPEIPSATEMEQNGMELKTMNLKLLQKVEELTLYVIDLQKQVNELKQTKNK